MQLLVIFGPPAVGKMTVGRAIAARSAFRLHHNHATIEPLLEVFDYGTPPFDRLLTEFRRRVVEEAAAAGTDLVLTFVWGLELPDEATLMASYVDIYRVAGADVAFVELAADLATRLERNRTEHRLDVKPSKRDLEWSDGNVRELEAHVLTSDPGRPTPADALLRSCPHLVVDNTHVSPEEVADRVLTWLSTVGSAAV